jgi:hypothetical protein
MLILSDGIVMDLGPPKAKTRQVKNAISSNRSHIAFSASDPEAVRRFHHSGSWTESKRANAPKPR